MIEFMFGLIFDTAIFKSASIFNLEQYMFFIIVSVENAFEMILYLLYFDFLLDLFHEEPPSGKIINFLFYNNIQYKNYWKFISIIM